MNNIWEDEDISTIKSNIITNEHGAKQSRVDERLDLIPTRAVLAIGRVLAEGEGKYPAIDGRPNWELIPTREHVNHALVHLYKHLSGDVGEEHLTHAVCRLLFALELRLRF